MEIIAHIDGSCEPRNPGGKMGIGVSVQYDGKKHDHCDNWEENPNNSNNVAEYLALLYLLKFIRNNDFKNRKIIIKSDSQLLINQAKGDWKIKKGMYAENARLCRREIIGLASERNIDFKFQWIPREENMYADNLSKL